MPRKNSANFIKLNAELFAADAAVDPLLVTAKISTLKVEGRDVPAAEAPLPAKISAIGALIASGDNTEESANLIAENGKLAASFEKLENELAVANGTIGAHVQKISKLETEHATAQQSVQQLTAEAGTSKNLLEASAKEVSRLLALNNATNSEISAFALKANCLDFTAEDGKPLAKDATEAQKLEAANRIPVADKMKAIFGAVNAAVAKTGVSFATVPAPAPANPQKDEAKGRNRFSAAVVVPGINKIK